MKVNLLHFTGSPDTWTAADLMIFTKNTRIKMEPDGLSAIGDWPEEKKMEELTYMANTIRSSWEFCDYVFLLEDVTRAFTHQMVRTRHGSYAQQTQQVLEIDSDAVEPPRGELSKDAQHFWEYGIGAMSSSYQSMLLKGATIEQARGILPTNIKTNIVAKVNLRTLVEIFDQRISPRNLGEYRQVAVDMRQEVLNVHPWAHVFIDQSRDEYLRRLDKELTNSAPFDGEKINRMLKLVDQLRRSREVRDDE